MRTLSVFKEQIPGGELGKGQFWKYPNSNLTHMQQKISYTAASFNWSSHFVYYINFGVPKIDILHLSGLNNKSVFRGMIALFYDSHNVYFRIMKWAKRLHLQLVGRKY